MTDQKFFPGFEGDDEAQKPAAPQPKPAVAPAKPAFDPFAEVKVDTKAPAPPPAQAPAGRATKASPPPPPPPAAAAAATDEDADIKPGSRKDLWKCPHCAAGNKPDRNTCRTCGKSPDEPVVIPWYRNNVIRAGILAVIGLIIIGIVLVTRVDLSLHEPSLANVDKAPRIGGKGLALIELGSGLKLEGEQQISVCGRVAAIGSGPGGTILIALALGPAAADENPEAKPADGSFEVAGVVLACSAEDGFDPKPGQIISLTGVSGILVKDGRIADTPAGIIPVAVGEHRTAAP